MYFCYYTVLCCAEAPKVNRTTLKSTSTVQPFLPGTVAEYQCILHYKFKANSSISCQVDRPSKTAGWIGEEIVQCIPGRF